MLIRHLQMGSRIFLQVDCDCDGYLSAAILINYLHRFAPITVENNLTYRLHEDKTHGIILDTIPQNTKLVIVPDAGSNQNKEHHLLKEKGIDVLVLDHHLIDEELSKDACIINNQTCEYPNKTLCGAGVVYKFCCYLDEKLGLNYANDFLDLVAVALVTDMMDLRNKETKELMSLGIKSIKNPFLYEMVNKQDYQINIKNPGLNPHTIGFYIGPFVNAMTRSGTLKEKTLMFESMLEYKAYEQIQSEKRGAFAGQTAARVSEAIRVATNVKNRQDTIVKKDKEIIDTIIKEKHLLENNKILVVKLDKEYEVDKNIVGLVANKMANEYQRPTLLLNQVENSWRGSGRNPGFSKITSLRDYLLRTNLVEYCSGHDSAFGLGIKDSDFEEFMNHTNEDLKNINLNLSYHVDFIIKERDLGSQLDDIIKIAELENIWGQEIPKPLIAVEGINLSESDVQFMGKGVCKIVTSNITFISFGMEEEEYEKLLEVPKYQVMNLVGYCKKNEWNGFTTAQIEIVDYDFSVMF